MSDKVVIYLGGGVMSGVFGAGIVTELELADVYDKLESVYGGSAGAFNAAYFLTRQSELGSSIYWENLTNNFIFPARIFSGTAQRFWRRYISQNGKTPSNVVDIDHLMRIVKGEKQLDLGILTTQGVPFYIKVLDTHNAEIVYLNSRKDTLETLKASASAIPYYFPINQRYIDGEISKEPIGLPFILERHPYTRIVVAINYTPDQGWGHVLKNSLEGIVTSFMYRDSLMFNHFHTKIKKFRRDIEEARRNEQILLVHPPRENPTRLNTTDSKKLRRTWNMGRKEAEKILRFLGL